MGFRRRRRECDGLGQGKVFGIGGAPNQDRNFLFLQAGASVAIMLTDKLFIRPQVRFQDWERGLVFGDNRRAISFAVAIGFRLPAFD